MGKVYRKKYLQSEFKRNLKKNYIQTRDREERYRENRKQRYIMSSRTSIKSMSVTEELLLKLTHGIKKFYTGYKQICKQQSLTQDVNILVYNNRWTFQGKQLPIALELF